VLDIILVPSIGFCCVKTSCFEFCSLQNLHRPLLKRSQVVSEMQRSSSQDPASAQHTQRQDPAGNRLQACTGSTPKRNEPQAKILGRKPVDQKRR